MPTYLLIVIAIALIIPALLLVLRWLNRLSLSQDHTTASELADILQSLIDGTDEKWDLDDFATLPLRDPELEEIRLRCVTLLDEYPAGESDVFCGPEGVRIIEGYIETLRSRERAGGPDNQRD